MSDPSCVSRVVDSWTFSDTALKSAAQLGGAEPAVSFTYRYRPSDQARMEQREQDAAGIAQLCAAYQGTPIDEHPNVRYRQVRPTLPWRVTEQLDAILESLNHVNPKDVREIFPVAFREAAQQIGASPRCRALRGWSPALTFTELLEAEPEELPAGSSCSARVAALRAFAAQKPLPSTPTSDLSTKAGLQIIDPGFVVGEAPAPALLATSTEIARLAAEQKKAQGKDKPVVYLKVAANAPGPTLVDAALHWGARFEVRVLVLRRRGAPFVNTAATAWKKAVDAHLYELRNATPANQILELVRMFREDGPLCAGVPGALKAVELVKPEDRLQPFASALADALEGCQCPAAYAEVLWARFTLMEDTWAEGAAFVSLPVTTDKKATAVDLWPQATAQNVLERLEGTDGGPVRVTFGKK